MPGIDARGLVFGIPSCRIINAAFCHSAPNGSRFNSADRSTWYAGFESETSQSEVAYHRQLWLQETDWNKEEIAEYVDYRADFRAEFDDIRGTRKYRDCVSPTSYVASQAFAARLLEAGSAGIVYPSDRRARGTCIACFPSVLVTNVQEGEFFTFVFAGSRTAPTIRRLNGDLPLRTTDLIRPYDLRHLNPKIPDGPKEQPDVVVPSFREKGKKPLYASSFVADYLRPAAITAGVSVAEGQRFGLHNLRHSLSNWLVNKAKVQAKTVQSLLRHAQIKTTLGPYTQEDGNKIHAAQGEFLAALGMKSGQSSEFVG